VREAKNYWHFFSLFLVTALEKQDVGGSFPLFFSNFPEILISEICTNKTESLLAP
jgi:hypothetical protein